MVQQETIEQLKKLVAECLGAKLSAEQLDPDLPLMEAGLNLDSLALVNLIAAVEKEFAVEFGEGMLNLEVFANLRSLASAIIALRGAAQSQC